MLLCYDQQITLFSHFTANIVHDAIYYCKFLDLEGGSQKATLVVLVVVMSSLKSLRLS